MAKIFISDRREDSQAWTGAIHRHLRSALPCRNRRVEGLCHAT
jgi:hypothetical protein